MARPLERGYRNDMSGELPVPQPLPQQVLTAHLANERTHLAYVRTAVSFIGLGTALNRFARYLLEIKAIPERRWYGPAGQTEDFGLGLVVFGIVILVWATARYTRGSYAIDRGAYRPSRLMVWTLSLFIFLVATLGLPFLFRR